MACQAKVPETLNYVSTSGTFIKDTFIKEIPSKRTGVLGGPASSCMRSRWKDKNIEASFRVILTEAKHGFTLW